MSVDIFTYIDIPSPFLGPGGIDLKLSALFLGCGVPKLCRISISYTRQRHLLFLGRSPCQWQTHGQFIIPFSFQARHTSLPFPPLNPSTVINTPIPHPHPSPQPLLTQHTSKRHNPILRPLTLPTPRILHHLPQQMLNRLPRIRNRNPLRRLNPRNLER